MDKEEPKFGRAVKLMLRYGVAKLNMDKIVTFVVKEDEDGNKWAREIGFTLEGTLRKNAFYHGASYDINIYGILGEEL